MTALYVSAVFVIAFVAMKVRRNRKPRGPVEDGTGPSVDLNAKQVLEQQALAAHRPCICGERLDTDCACGLQA